MSKPIECAYCDESYALRDGPDPTKYCDECAHLVAIESENRIEDLERDLLIECAKNEVLEQRLHDAESQRDEWREECNQASLNSEAWQSRALKYGEIVADFEQRLRDAEARLETAYVAGYDAMQADLTAANARIAELGGLLRELHALVMGECRSLLDEDSGGNSNLAIAIEHSLAKLDADTFTARDDTPSKSRMKRIAMQSEIDADGEKGK